MFKWNKSKHSSGEPPTPKLALATLPDTDNWKESFNPKASLTSGRSFKSFLGRLTPDRRAETPYQAPLPSHRRKEAHVPRLRTVSMSNHDDDIILLKPHKASPPSAPAIRKPTISHSDIQKPPPLKASPKYVPATVASLPVTGGGGRKTANPEQHPVPLKSALKGGDLQTTTVARQEFPLVPLERRASSRRVSISPPRDHYVTAQVSRSRNSSLTEQHRPGYPVSHQTPKYVPAIIKEVAMKGEAIAVSWPLADYASRRNKGTPALYFDVGFDPRKDQWAVRVSRGGFLGPITREESDISVSPHTILTEVTITCKPPAGFPDHFTLWPIYVRRSRGLRCIDVFRAIFDTYNVLLTEKERAQIGEQYLRRCERAFKQRCKDSPGLPLYNEECGMRRVDVLRGRRIFKAITQDPTNTYWILHFDEL